MQAPSALSRFAFFLLFSSVAMIFAMLWFLHHLPAPPKGRPAGTVQPPAQPTPGVTASPAVRAPSTRG